MFSQKCKTEHWRIEILDVFFSLSICQVSFASVITVLNVFSGFLFLLDIGFFATPDLVIANAPYVIPSTLQLEELFKQGYQSQFSFQQWQLAKVQYVYSTFL